MDNLQELIAENAASQAQAHLIDGNFPVIQLHNDYQLVSLIKYLPAPQRFTGRFITNYIDAFATYCANQQGENAKCFIEPNTMEAKTIFDFGTLDAPQHRDHDAILKLELTEEYHGLISADKHKYPQRGFIEWLEDYRDNITFYRDEVEIAFSSGLSALRSITKSKIKTASVESLSQSQSLLESIDSAGDTLMPTGFNFSCLPYNGLSPIKAYCRINFFSDEDSEKITFSFSIVRREKIDENITMNFKDVLLNMLTNTAVYIGTWRD